MTDIVKDRRILESPWEQSVGESVAYTLTIPTTWGTSTLSSISSKLWEDPNVTNTERTSTMLTGSASASGQVITTETVTGLTIDLDYRLEVTFTTSEGNTLVAWGLIRAWR